MLIIHVHAFKYLLLRFSDVRGQKVPDRVSMGSSWWLFLYLEPTILLNLPKLQQDWLPACPASKSASWEVQTMELFCPLWLECLCQWHLAAFDTTSHPPRFSSISDLYPREIASWPNLSRIIRPYFFFISIPKRKLSAWCSVILLASHRCPANSSTVVSAARRRSEKTSPGYHGRHGVACSKQGPHDILGCHRVLIPDDKGRHCRS